MAKILIAGGTGLIGTRLTQLLQTKGHQILLLSRKGNPSEIPEPDNTNHKNSFAEGRRQPFARIRILDSKPATKTLNDAENSGLKCCIACFVKGTVALNMMTESTANNIALLRFGLESWLSVTGCVSLSSIGKSCISPPNAY